MSRTTFSRPLKSGGLRLVALIFGAVAVIVFFYVAFVDNIVSEPKSLLSDSNVNRQPHITLMTYDRDTSNTEIEQRKSRVFGDVYSNYLWVNQADNNSTRLAPEDDFRKHKVRAGKSENQGSIGRANFERHTCPECEIFLDADGEILLDNITKETRVTIELGSYLLADDPWEAYESDEISDVGFFLDADEKVFDSGWLGTFDEQDYIGEFVDADLLGVQGDPEEEHGHEVGTFIDANVPL